MIVRELLTVWGFDVDDKPLKQLDASIETVNNVIKKTATVGIAAASTLFGLAKTSAMAGNSIAKTADKLGLSTDALQEFRFAAQNATDLGISQIDVGLQRFTRRVAEAAAGAGEAKATLEELDVQLVNNDGTLRSSEEVLMDVADAMAGVEDEETRLRLAFKLFDSEGVGFVNLLKRGSAEVKALRQEARDLGGVLAEEDVRAAEEFEDSMLRLTTAIKGNAFAIGAELMPEVMSIVESMTEWIKNNRALIAQRIDTLLNTLRLIVSGLSDAFRFLVALISTVVDAFGGLEQTARLVGLALLFMASTAIIASLSALVAAVIPVAKAIRTVGFAAIFTHKAFKRTILGALLTGLVLFLEDLYQWVRGGKSLLGDWLGSWESFKESIIGVFTSIGEGFDSFIRWIREGVDSLIGVFDGVIDRISRVIGMGANLINSFTTGLKNIPSIRDTFELIPVIGDIPELIPSIGDISKLIPSIGDISESIPSIGNLIGPDGMTSGTSLGMMQPATASAGGVSAQQTINANVTVNARPGMSQEDIALVREQAEAGVANSLERAAARLIVNQPGYLYNGTD